MVPVRTMFLVRRLGLRHWGGGCHRTPNVSSDTLNHPDDAPRTVPVALLATRDKAEARARELERADRRLLNPFWYGNCVRSEKTSLTEEEFLARLAGLGLQPPRGEGRFQTRNWWDWWEENAHDWPDDLFHAFWDLLDCFRLYDVVEVEVEDAPAPV